MMENLRQCACGRAEDGCEYHDPKKNPRRRGITCVCGPLRNDEEHFDDCPAKGPYGKPRPRPAWRSAAIPLEDDPLIRAARAL